MNGQPDRRREALPVVELQQIDRACEQFRSAWEAGQRPRIEDYLAAASDAARAELLRRLVAEELVYRSRSGEMPTPDEYAQRFPTDASTVRLAFTRSARSPSDRSEHGTHSDQNAALAETETQLWKGSGTQASGSSEQPEHIGRYKVLGILGRGGFGTVYRARDEELQRDVAIKVWRRDRFVGDEDVERLLQEARHVARLEKHPAIVGVYDVGRQEDGSAFVVLQFIEGHTLEQELKSHKLVRDRVWEIMMQVTAAIQHAHATGLVHRDLKPANVLLDADGNAHVSDFGLAIDDQSQRFHAGEVSGTPAYMAPEQVRGEAHRLDGRADIWALGVMLYEMLTQRRPFQGESRPELFDEILHREPKPPRQLSPEIPADLERICLKCLTKSITERYLTAADLAKDLRHAREAPQRRKRRLTTIALAVAAGLLVLGAVWVYLVVAGNQPTISVQPGSGLKIRHRATLRGHTDAVWSVAFSPDDRTLASAGVDMTVKLWNVPDAREVQQLTGHRGEVRCVTFAPDGQTLASASSDRSIVVWVRETGEMKRQLTGHTGDVRSVVFWPNGNQLVSASVDKTIRFWDPASGGEQKKIETHRASIQSVVCSRDGQTLASCSDDQTIELRSPEAGALLRTLTGHTDGVAQAAFSPDGRRLASASWDKTIRLWDVASGKLLLTIDKHGDAVRSVALSPDGKRLASGGNDNTIRLWDTENGVELATLRGHKGPVTSVAFSTDGRILASASADRTVMMWELEDAGSPQPEDRLVEKPPSRKPTTPPVAQADAGPSKTGTQPVVPTQITDAAPPPPAIAPFDAATARKHQEAWAKHLGVPVEMTNSIGMRFVLIPPGEFDMGSTEAEVAKLLEQAKARKLSDWYIQRLPAEAPKHRVRITKPLYLGLCEVTQAEYERVVGSNPSKFKGDPTRPVEMVSWDGASAFCRKLAELPSEQAAARAEYRLPTEAEWEYACRAGTTSTWYSGDDEAGLKAAAWFGANAGETTHPVCQKAPNAWGLYDMHGNVWEWCQDWFGDRYYATSPTHDPVGPSGGSGRVNRGGGWGGGASGCRASLRDWGSIPGNRYGILGFRLTRSVSLTEGGIPSPRKSGNESPQSNQRPPSEPSAPATTPPAAKPAPAANKPARPAPPLAVAPFDARKAKEHQAAWSKHLGVPVEIENSIGMRFVLIPPGEFDMGSTEAEVAWAIREGKNTAEHPWYFDRVPTEGPRHRIKISWPFYLGAYEVTQGEYQQVTGTNPSAFLTTGNNTSDSKMEAGKGTSRHPVESLLWKEATEFCRRVSGLSAEGTARREYRLPTEAEWEYACRAGSTTRWSCGDDETMLFDHMWCSRNSESRTHPVGQQKPNAWGLYDMHGNVWEWCEDRFERDFYEQSVPTDPRAPATGHDHVIRGGAWVNSPYPCRSASRNGVAPTYRAHHTGFRIVLGIPAKEGSRKAKGST